MIMGDKRKWLILDFGFRIEKQKQKDYHGSAEAGEHGKKQKQKIKDYHGSTEARKHGSTNVRKYGRTEAGNYDEIMGEELKKWATLRMLQVFVSSSGLFSLLLIRFSA